MQVCILFTITAFRDGSQAYLHGISSTDIQSLEFAESKRNWGMSYVWDAVDVSIKKQHLVAFMHAADVTLTPQN